MILPSSGSAPLPHPKMPDDIKADYLEARSVASVSPRGAAALLRLCIQKLCIHLNQPGDNLSRDIGELVKQGLPKGVQQALDIVRVTGNHAVHPGQIDFDDKPEIANSLFKLVNLITEKMIAEPAEVAALYAGLPEDERQRIERRDGMSAS